jgi:hypothetical protein
MASELVFDPTCDLAFRSRRQHASNPNVENENVCLQREFIHYHRNFNGLILLETDPHHHFYSLCSQGILDN